MFLTFTFGISIVEAQEVPEFGKIRPGTLKNGALSKPYDMVGSWSESFLDFHFIPSQAGLLGTGDNISGGPDNYMNFRMMFPVGYDSLDEDTSYPIILFLHGAGESGRGWGTAYSTTDPRYDNNSHQLVHGGRRHRDAVLRDPSHPESFNGFLVFPQSHRSGAWAGNYADEKENAKAALGILQILIRNLKIDPSRIYVTGLSAGGQGTWEAILRKPELFAAAAPVSGAGNTFYHVPLVNHIPIWISQGGTDRNPNPGASTTMLNSLEGQGVPYYDPLDATRIMDLPSPYTNANLNRYSLYPTLGHGVWNNTYNRRDYFQWLLSKKKNTIRIFGNNTEICLGEGVKLGVTTRFEDYQWTLNGQAFEAGNGLNEIIATEPGVYRVRFKNVPNHLNIEWSDWSDPVLITIKDAPDAPRVIANSTSVKATGDVTLEGPAGYATGQYQWFFNGASLSTAEQSRTLQNRSAPGEYALAVRGPSGCYSPLTTFTFYNPTTVEVLNVPTNLEGIPGVTTVDLTWNDNSPNETGFEIHRRTGADENSWRLVHITGENETSFTDYGLIPNTSYTYRIHAINPTGNSGPSSSITRMTNPDTEAPSVVGNLWGTIDFSQNVTLTWDAATDNVGVVGYWVYEPNSTTVVRATVPGLSYVMEGLSNATTYTFSVSAIDAAGNVSPPASVEVQTFSIGNGVTYKYYHGDWSLLPDFSLLTPLLTGIHTNFNLNAPRLQDDFFGYWFDGFIDITTAGNYTFWTRSDDGSKLFVTPTGGTRTEVVNNDGLHGNQNRSGVINLAPGRHRIEVHYFERTGGQNLEVRYAFGNNISWANSAMIPNNRLFTYRDNQPPTTINNLQAISTDASITLSWDAARDNFGMKGYNIYNSSDQKIGFTDALNFNIGDLQPETAYTFSVSALDLFDNESPKVSISTNTLSVQQPIAPTNLTAIAQSFDRVLLRWKDNSDNETGFQIERRLTTDPDESFALVATAPKNAVEFVNTGLVSNTSYTYRLRAVNTNYQSDYSNNRIIRTQPDLPLAPSALQVVINPDSASFTISWTDNSTSEDGFQLWKSLNADEGYNLLATIGPDTVTYIDQEVSVGTRFYYRVRAFNKDGNSAYAGPVGAHIPGPLNVSPVNWKLIPTAANVPNHSDIVADWMNGEDYMDEIRLDTGSVAKKQFNFRLPTNMPDDGMFIYSFRNPFPAQGLSYDNSQAFDRITVRLFISDNSTNGTDGTWTNLPNPIVRFRNNDLQKIDLLQSYAGKWIRVEIQNTATQHIFLKEFGLYQFIPGQRHNYIILLGASLMEGMGSHRDFHNNIQQSFPGFGFQPVVFNWSVGGTVAGAFTSTSPTAHDRLQNIDTVLAQHPRAGYVMFHTGGNNVTATRPADFSFVDGYIQTSIVNPIVTAIDKIKAAGKIPVMAPLTFRDYKENDAMKPGIPVNQGFNQERGSLPYNLSLFEVIREHVPDFYNETERRPWIDIYGALFNNQGIIGPDGIHHSNPAAFRQMWIDMAFKYIYTGERNKPVIWQTIDGELDELVEAKVAEAELSMLLSDIWHARIFAQQVSDRFNRLAFLDRLDSLEGPIHFYIKHAGANPAQLESWSHTPDGQGNSPSQFKFDRQVFVVDKNTTLNQNWEVNGFRNRVRVASGATFNVNNNVALRAVIDVDSAGLFEFNGINSTKLSDIPFTIGELHSKSKVHLRYLGEGVIPPGTYGDLELGTTNNQTWQKITFAPNLNTRINGDLTVSRGRLSGNNADGPNINVSNFTLGGNLILRNNASFLAENQNSRTSLFLIGEGEQKFIYQSTNPDRTYRFHILDIGSNSKLVIEGNGINLEIGRVGSTVISGLNLNNGASLDLGTNNLIINAIANINPNNQTGKILSNGGNITFNSTSAQNSNLYFDSLHNRLNSLNLGTNQSGSGTIHIRSRVDISQKLDVKAGNLNSNGHIRLLSDASSTAYIDRVGASANITGEFTIQRFLPQQPRRWRYMTFPVQGFLLKIFKQPCLLPEILKALQPDTIEILQSTNGMMCGLLSLRLVQAIRKFLT